MERRRPQCRGAVYGTDESASAHEPHNFFPSRYAEPVPCTGWTITEADACALADRLDQVVRDALRGPLPVGVRLECHPAVPHVLQNLFIPGYDEFVASLRTGEDVLKPQMPVVVTPGMRAGQWRITTDAGDIAGGVIRTAA